MKVTAQCKLVLVSENDMVTSYNVTKIKNEIRCLLSFSTEAFVNAPLRDGQDVCNPLQPNATQRQDLIYKEFMKAFLSRNDTDGWFGIF